MADAHDQLQIPPDTVELTMAYGELTLPSLKENLGGVQAELIGSRNHHIELVGVVHHAARARYTLLQPTHKHRFR